MTTTLFERLGGSDAIRKISSDLVDNHLTNPKVSPRFAAADTGKLKKAAGDFFITGSGGPAVYTGEDMIAVHRNMNISGEEFLAVLDDAMGALEKNSVGQREKEEVLYILYSLKGQVMGQ